MGRRRGKRRRSAKGSVKQNFNSMPTNLNTNYDQKESGCDAPASPKVAIQNPHPETRGQSPANEGDGGNRIIARWTKLLGVSTVVLSIATIVTGFVLFSTELTLRGTLSATQSAADAARKSAEIAEQTLRMAERPILGVGNWEFSNIAPNSIPIIKYRIGNNGRSGADVFDQVASIVYADQLPAAPVYRANPFAAVIPGGGGFVTANLDNPPPPVINPERYKLIVERKQFVFVYGRVSYRDTFDDIYDLGYVVRIEAVKSDNGAVTFRDAVPAEGAPFVYLKKRPKPEKQ